MNTKISVVIPVYKVEKYIHQCIDSVLAQTLQEIEILLVDDGSPDRCGEICDQYAERDSRIKVIHKENGGLMSAWKAGMKLATGKYIGFVDSDDWIDRDMFERMYEKATQYNAEIVVCGLVREFDNHSERDEINWNSGVYYKTDIVEKIYPKLINDGNFLGRGISPNRFTKIFLAHLVNENLQYCFEDISYGEDMHLMFSAFADVNTVYIISEYYPYHYRINAESITGSYNPKLWSDILKLNNNLKSISEQKNVYDFQNQIEKDLLSLSILAVVNEFHPNNKKTDSEKLFAIEKICMNSQLRLAWVKADLSKFNISKRLMIWLIAHEYLLTTFLLRKAICVFRVCLKRLKLSCSQKCRRII